MGDSLVTVIINTLFWLLLIMLFLAFWLGRRQGSDTACERNAEMEALTARAREKPPWLAGTPRCPRAVK